MRARAEAALHGQSGGDDDSAAEHAPCHPRPDAENRCLGVRVGIGGDQTPRPRQITEALAGAGISLPTGPAPLPSTEVGRHVWVQARSGTEWVDLNPTVAGTQPGQAIASVVGEPFATIPDDLRHRLDIDLVLEKVAGDGVAQEAIIEHSRFADELTHVPIAIGHAKPGALKELGAGIESVLLGGTRYLARRGSDRVCRPQPHHPRGGLADPSATADPSAGS